MTESLTIYTQQLVYGLYAFAALFAIFMIANKIKKQWRHHHSNLH